MDWNKFVRCLDRHEFEGLTKALEARRIAGIETPTDEERELLKSGPGLGVVRRIRDRLGTSIMMAKHIAEKWADLIAEGKL